MNRLPMPACRLLFRTLAVLLAAPLAVLAQPLPQQTPVDQNPYAADARPQVSVGAVVQRYGIEGDYTASSLAVPFTATIPLAGGRVGVTARASYVNAEVEEITSVSGLADAGFGVHLRHRLGPAEALVGLGVGLPVGAKQLTPEEFFTALTLGRNELAFAVPQVGQGFQAAPSVAVAFPLGPLVAAGAGATFVRRSGYQPFAETDSTYDPGDELLLTAGVEADLRVVALSLDLAYTRYGEDAFGTATFAPGNRFVATARVGGSKGYFLARYRHRADGTIPNPAAGADSVRTVIPFRPYEIRLESGGRTGLGPVALGFGVAARYYGDLRRFEEIEGVGDTFGAVGEHQLVFDLAARPAISVGERAEVTGQFTYSIGLGTLALPDDVPRLVGFAAGVGIRVGL